MTHLANELKNAWPRCPACGCLGTRLWLPEHRSGCRFTNVDINEWTQE